MGFVLFLLLAEIVTSCTTTTPSPVPSPVTKPTKQLPDTDGDGMSDWFETNVAKLDPTVPNVRYAIILNTVTEHIHPYYTNQRQEETRNLKTFLIEEEKFNKITLSY